MADFRLSIIRFACTKSYNGKVDIHIEIHSKRFQAKKIMTQYKLLFCVILCAKCLDDHYEWTTIRMFSTYLISTIEQNDLESMTKEISFHSICSDAFSCRHLRNIQYKKKRNECDDSISLKIKAKHLTFFLIVARVF